ncbi:hypothetical protein Plhal304r1_c029g0096571 [Plasmopara halstedii]
MDFTQTPVNASLSLSMDTHVMMADLVWQREMIRRANTEAEATRRRVETAKSLAWDIKAIKR